MIALQDFFPLGVSHYLLGGILIGIAVSLLYVLTGLQGGLSTVYTTFWSYLSKAAYFQRPENLAARNWRTVYSLGLILGGIIWVSVSSVEVPLTGVPLIQLAIGGFIAGFGARLGNGCTSGHGICGIASLSSLSLVAVIVFLTIAIITAHLVQLLTGVAP